MRGSPKWERRSASGVILLAAHSAFAGASLRTNEGQLLPSAPRGELPLSFMEQYGVWLALACVLAAVTAAALWLLLRRKTTSQEPIEVWARRELTGLGRHTEDGTVLSRISHILRIYLATAFELPPGELTTAEFSRVMNASEKAGTEIAARVSDFLRRCDELKFAAPPSPPPPPIQAAAGALALVEFGETRRAWLRQQESIATGKPAPSPA